MVDARFTPAPIARWEWGLLACLCLLALAYWVMHYHPFVMPGSDFGSVERLAHELLAFDSPTNYKRMPVFPVLAGVVSKALPVDRPVLHAALGLNIAFSLGIIIVTFLLCRRLIGPAALVVTASLLVTVQLHAECLQPLLEPCLTFLILLALFLFVRGSRWQYLAAGLAAFTRYEAAALIAIFFVLNLVQERHVRTHLLLALLASVGFVTWMGLSMLHHSGGNPYLSQMSEQGYAPAWSMATTMFSPVHQKFELTYIFLPLAVIGAIGSWVRFRIPSVAILSFAMMYLIAHIAFGVHKSGYAHPVIWIPPLYIVTGVLVIARWIRNRKWRLADRIPHLAYAAGGAAFLIVAMVRSLTGLPEDEGIHHHAVYICFFGALGLLVTAGSFLALYRKKALPAAALAMLIGGTFFVAGYRPVAKQQMDALSDAYFAKYDAYIGTQWLVQHAQPDEQALLFSRTAFPAFSADLRAVTFGNLKAMTHEELVAELVTRDIDYVVYWSRKGIPDPNKGNYERHLYYYNRYKVWLADPFSRGDPVPGFQHLATLPMPERTKQPPVQIYRFLRNNDDHPSPTQTDENH